MKSLLRVRSLMIALVAIGGLILAPAVTTAQGGLEDPGAGQGAPIVEPSFGGDPATLNPILSADGTSANIIGNMFPLFIGINPETGLPEKGVAGSIVKDWTVSEDGLTYTFTLRDDWKWSDGTTINAEDVKYAYDAITSGKVDTTLVSFVDNIGSVEATNATTLVIKFKELDCAAILTASALPVVPAHKYKEIYPTFEQMTPDNEYNLNPTVSAGPFKFRNFRAGEQVTLEADQSYPDAVAGHVIPEGWVLKNLADANVGVEQFLAGDVSYIPSIPEERQDELKQLGEQGQIQYGELPAATRHLVMFNTADPNNPKNATDEQGNRIEQGNHPLFGDVRVRQAFALSVNHEALNQGAFSGHGIAIGTPVLPQTWAHNQNIKPWPFDLARAAALLEEAGFVDNDNNPETPRVATEAALYAEPGTPLEFTFLAFSGNPSVESAAVLLQDQLKQSGFKVNLEIIEFQTFVEKLLGQQFDVATVFLGISRNNPGNSLLSHFGTEGDRLGSGLNVSSWYNEEFENAVKQSQALPGCDQAERKALLDRAQEIVYEELPWYFLNYSMVPFAVQGDLKNYDPKPFNVTWNIDAWFLPRAR